MARVVPISEIVRSLGSKDLLPAIVFRTSRLQCDNDAEYAGKNNRLHLSPGKQREIRAAAMDVIDSYDLEREIITAHPQYRSLINTGIGAHHAGQLLVWRLLLEELMAQGFLKVLIATGTVAAGVDFPARTVVITADSRRGPDGYVKFSPTEFQQMSGRAGRRGKDTVGFCVAAPGAFCDARRILKVSKRKPDPLVSAYFPSPSTVLNLLRYRNVDDLRYTVARSLASFIDKRDAEVLRQDALILTSQLPSELKELVDEAVSSKENEFKFDEENEEYKKEHKNVLKKIRRLFRNASALDRKQADLLDSSLNGLKDLGYLDGYSLSEKGYWSANICTNIVLELSEIIESGLLEKVSMEKLVAIIASVAGEEHRKYIDSVKENVLSKDEVSQISEIISKVRSKSMPGVLEQGSVVMNAANSAVLWLKTDTWQVFRTYMTFSGVAEGDMARLLMQTAEQLGQITKLSETHPELAVQAEDAKRRILRPPLTDVIHAEVRD